MLGGVWGGGMPMPSGGMGPEPQYPSTAADEKMSRLDARMDALVLTNMALWTLLRDKLGLTDAQLEERVKQLDLADGQQDGKIRVQAWKCPKCDRPNSPRHRKCLYCGFENAASTPFPVR